MTKKIQIGEVQVTVTRPELSPEERKKRESGIEAALAKYIRQQSGKGQKK